MSYCARRWVIDVHIAPVIQEHPLILWRVVSLVGQVLLEHRASWEQYRSSVNRIECLVYLNPLGVRLLCLWPDNVQLIERGGSRLASPFLCKSASKEVHFRIALFEAYLLILLTRLKDHEVFKVEIFKPPYFVEDVNLTEWLRTLQGDPVGLGAIEPNLLIFPEHQEQVIS